MGVPPWAHYVHGSFTVSGLPSAPKRSNVTIVHNSSSVTITWLPSPNEHNVSVLYTVECSRCKNLTDTDCLSSYCGSMLTFHPKKESISWLNVTIGGLQKATKYKFTVYSVNQLTAPVPRSKWKYLEIFAKTGKGMFITDIIDVLQSIGFQSGNCDKHTGRTCGRVGFYCSVASGFVLV